MKAWSPKTFERNVRKSAVDYMAVHTCMKPKAINNFIMMFINAVSSPHGACGMRGFSIAYPQTTTNSDVARGNNVKSQLPAYI